MAVYGFESKKEIVSFRKVILANTTDVLHERIKADGTIENVKIRLYQGNQKSLRVRPYVEHKGSKIEDVITYASTSDNFISGDDDYFVFDITVPVQYDDYIKIWVQNVDGTYDYTLSVDVEVDYIGGKTSRKGGGN